MDFVFSRDTKIVFLFKKIIIYFPKYFQTVQIFFFFFLMYSFYFVERKMHDFFFVAHFPHFIYRGVWLRESNVFNI